VQLADVQSAGPLSARVILEVGGGREEA
jgi:hypothetical protein